MGFQKQPDLLSTSTYPGNTLLKVKENYEEEGD